MDHSRSPRRVAVLLAGGVGTRVGLSIPKQLIKVAGKTILEHALVTLHDHPMVDEIVIMMTPGYLDAVHAIVRSGDYTKVTAVVPGERPATRPRCAPWTPWARTSASCSSTTRSARC